MYTLDQKIVTVYGIAIVYWIIYAVAAIRKVFLIRVTLMKCVDLVVYSFSMIIQYSLFDGVRRKIPQQVELWIKFSQYISYPFMVIMFIRDILDLNLSAILTFSFIGSLVQSIKIIKAYFLEELQTPPIVGTA